MAAVVKVYLDFVCPYCYLAEFPLKSAVEGLNVTVERLPFELRPYPQPTLRPEGDYLRKAWSQAVYPMAIRMGVEIRMPTISPQPYTHLAFEGLLFAKSESKADAYANAVLGGFFQANLDIGNVDVLTSIAGSVGLNESAFRTALVERQFQDEHRRALEHAYSEAGIVAVPTFVIGARRLEGVQTADELRAAIQSASGFGFSSEPSP